MKSSSRAGQRILALLLLSGLEIRLPQRLNRDTWRRDTWRTMKHYRLVQEYMHVFAYEMFTDSWLREWVFSGASK
jgi:hypothetical protein